MTTANDKYTLMRECVTTTYLTTETGVQNTVFDIEVPEGYAIELHEVNWIISSGSSPVTNRWKFYLVDDPDEDDDPGHCAEKVIQSAEFQTMVAGTTGRNAQWFKKDQDCHRTMLVVDPNFISVQDQDAGATITCICRIWFRFVKVSAQKILEMLRQQQY